MRVTKFIATTFIFFLLSSSLINAQTTKPSDINALDLLGKSYNSSEILHLLSLHPQNSNRQLLNPFGNSYMVECPSGGYALEFDISFTLKSIRLFDAGYTYKKCELVAPYQVGLGMHIDSIHLNNLLFQHDEYAEMKLFGDFAEVKVDLYFKEDHVEMIKINAKDPFMQSANLKNTENWKFRLVPDGECVSGKCTNDSGYMKWGNGLIEYKGAWSFGFPHGKGMYRDSFGNTYQGQFLLGFFWGEGSLTRTNEHYVGQMVMGEKTGHGLVKYTNGTTYEGNWKKDIISGKGRLEINKNYYYEGEFVEGIYHGQGKLGSKDGYYEGGFAKGKPHGRGEQFAYNSEKKLVGKWKNGLKHGIFQLSSPATETQNLRFENDIEVPLKDSE
jgi:hypothetical protein